MLLGGWHWQSWSDRGWDSLFFIHSLHEWLGGGEWVCVCVWVYYEHNFDRNFNEKHREKKFSMKIENYEEQT